MSRDDLDSFLYGKRGPPRPAAGPPPAPEAPPPRGGPQRAPRPDRAPRARRAPRIVLPPDWRRRVRPAATLCAAASVALSLLFLLSCGDRDAQGLCRPGPGGLGALGDPGRFGLLLGAAAVAAGAGGGVGVLLGPPKGAARLAGVAWLAAVWVVYLLYLLGAFGDPAKEGAALYRALTNTSSTQGWALALPYRVDDLVLGGLFGFPAALAPPAAFAAADLLSRAVGRVRGRRLDY
ncbi:MAG: hypothetical protein QXT68_06590 [Halobacteria archaeon]